MKESRKSTKNIICETTIATHSVVSYIHFQCFIIWLLSALFLLADAINRRLILSLEVE